MAIGDAPSSRLSAATRRLENLGRVLDYLQHNPSGMPGKDAQTNPAQVSQLECSTGNIELSAPAGDQVGSDQVSAQCAVINNANISIGKPSLRAGTDLTYSFATRSEATTAIVAPDPHTAPSRP
jgi:hypothetical protein